MNIQKSLLLISMVFISLLAISAVSAENNISDIAAISDADDSSDVLSVDENADQVSVVDVEKENVIKEAAADSDELAVPEESEELGFSFGNGTTFNFGEGTGFSFGNGTFDFKNITFSDGNGTNFNFGDLLNGTFTFGNGTQFNFSSLGNGTIGFNGTNFNISSLTNGTGFDISSIMNMFGGNKLSANATDITEVYSGPVTFKATILESDKPVESGKDVIFSIDNKNYIERTDANGTASLKIDLAAGEHYIFTEYNNEILAKNVITIKKAASKITAKAKSYKASVKTKKYVITLKNNKGKVIKKAKVTLTVKGKTYKATTNSKGKATFKITKLTKKGKHTAKIKFAGNGYYKASNASKKITIK